MINIILCVLACLSAAASVSCFQTKSRIEQDVQSGLLSIRLGEGINGPSYMIAACQVTGGLYSMATVSFIVFALLA